MPTLRRRVHRAHLDGPGPIRGWRPRRCEIKEENQTLATITPELSASRQARGMTDRQTEAAEFSNVRPPRPHPDQQARDHAGSYRSVRRAVSRHRRGRTWWGRSRWRSRTLAGAEDSIEIRAQEWPSSARGRLCGHRGHEPARRRLVETKAPADSSTEPAVPLAGPNTPGPGKVDPASGATGPLPHRNRAGRR